MSSSIAVCGAGPGLGRAVARRYAAEGYDVVLVARRREPLSRFSEQLAAEHQVKAHVVTADLSVTDEVPALAQRIREPVGEVDVLYYAPTPDESFTPAAELTPAAASALMPLIFYSLLPLVQQFLPSMLARGRGAILTAQGASTVTGLPNMSGPGPAQAAQRNYLQSLHAEVADRGVYVGMLYVGAVIENSAFHAMVEEASKAGTGRHWGPTVDPALLADLLWDMHQAKETAEMIYPPR